MASGILGKTNLSSNNTNYSVYTVPASKIASFTLSIVNRNASLDSQVKVALSTSGTPSDTDYIEYNIIVPAYGTFERTGIVANASTVLVVSSTSADLTAIAYGFEDTAS